MGKIVEYNDFVADVMSALNDKPKNWRKGQFVFNYIDEKYGVSRIVQFDGKDACDCFYDDSKINEFIDKCWHTYFRIMGEIGVV